MTLCSDLPVLGKHVPPVCFCRKSSRQSTPLLSLKLNLTEIKDTRIFLLRELTKYLAFFRHLQIRLLWIAPLFIERYMSVSSTHPGRYLPAGVSYSFSFQSPSWNLRYLKLCLRDYCLWLPPHDASVDAQRAINPCIRIRSLLRAALMCTWFMSRDLIPNRVEMDISESSKKLFLLF